MYQVYNTELYHFGVKGMKWGHHKTLVKTNNVRVSRNKEEDSSKKKILTKRNIAIGAVAVVGALALIGYANYNLNKKYGIPTAAKVMNFGKILDVNEMSNVDEIIKKGTKFHRISSKPIEDYAGEGKRIYTSFLRNDNHIYKETMPGFIKRWQASGIVDKSDGIYEHILKSKADIKIPSKRTMAEMYMTTTGYKEVDQGRYLQFMEKLNNRNNAEVNRFFDLAKSKGFNAIIDENDAGVLTKKPLILFDLENIIYSSDVKKVTKFARFINLLTM